MVRTHTDVGRYYDQPLASQVGVDGAGLIWFMGRDHLSPNLYNGDEIALDSSRWRDGISSRVMALARRMGIVAGDRVLDLGCGIGGPGRDIAAATGAVLCGVSVSIKQLETLRGLSQQTNSPFTGVVKGDMQRLPVASGRLDGVYSINSIYHVDDPAAVIGEAQRVLRPGGRFGVDDWFTTDITTPEQLATLRYNWSTSANGFHNLTAFMTEMERLGLEVIDDADYTKEAGEFLTEDRFGKVYDSQIAPTLTAVFPKLYQYEGYEPAHADQAVAQLRSDVLYMGALYRGGAAVYRQIVGHKT